MSAEIVVEVAAAGLAMWAAWLTIPRPPDLDWERLFKVALATVIRGDVEAAGADVDEWLRRLEAVPYNPAGRSPERLLADPSAVEPPTPALEGERALVEALARLDDPTSRFTHMYRGDPRGLDALMGDPAMLGDDYDPERLFGPGCTWDALAEWSDVVRAAFQRRMGHVRFVGLGGVGGEVVGDQAGLPGMDLDDVDALPDALDAAKLAPSDRLVFLVGGGAVSGLLDLLHRDLSVRDRTLAVVALGADVQASPDQRRWFARCFHHTQLEPEVQRVIPYVSVIDTDPAAPLARKWDAQRFPPPPDPSDGRASIASVDLGPLVLAQVPETALARALLILLAFRLSD